MVPFARRRVVAGTTQVEIGRCSGGGGLTITTPWDVVRPPHGDGGQTQLVDLLKEELQ
jgi:hypothetical protein